MISFSNVQKSFGNFRLFEDISFQIEAGEQVSLIGPDSSGKSTIIKMLLGLIQPDAGQAKLDGEEVYKLRPKEQARILSKVGMSFQQGGLFDFMNVADNLHFAMDHMTKLSRDEQGRILNQLLEDVKLPGTANKYPYELSGGMQKRVSIARALCTNPSIALFDEPTAGLDPVTSTIILNMIKALGRRREGNTMLVATSNVEIGIRFATRVLVLNEGRIVADGDWRDLIMNGDPWVQKFLSVRLIGLDREYAEELHLPAAFIEKHWQD